MSRVMSEKDWLPCYVVTLGPESTRPDARVGGDEAESPYEGLTIVSRGEWAKRLADTSSMPDGVVLPAVAPPGPGRPGSAAEVSRLAERYWQEVLGAEEPAIEAAFAATEAGDALLDAAGTYTQAVTALLTV